MNRKSSCPFLTGVRTGNASNFLQEQTALPPSRFGCMTLPDKNPHDTDNSSSGGQNLTRIRTLSSIYHGQCRLKQPTNDRGSACVSRMFRGPQLDWGPNSRGLFHIDRTVHSLLQSGDTPVCRNRQASLDGGSSLSSAGKLLRCIVSTRFGLEITCVKLMVYMAPCVDV